MKTNYKFCNLLGTVYHGGNVAFAPGGTTVFSPVGNRLSVFDLKSHKSRTLPFESQFNLTVVALNPAGSHAILVNEHGEGLYVSLASQTILHRHRFNKPVRDIKFSPDGKKFTVCRDTDVQLFHCPDPKKRQFNPFSLQASFHASHDCTNSLDWSSDSNLFAAACADMKTCVCGAKNFKNLFMYALSGHTGSVVACFFQKDSFDIFTLEKRGFLVHWEANITAEDLVEREVVSNFNASKTSTKGHESDSSEEIPASDQEARQTEVPKLSYSKLARHSFHEAVPGSGVTLTCAAYQKEKALLVTGFSNGAFVLHELPDFNLIHSLSVSEQSIMTVSLNKHGDWLALGCGGRGERKGQLLVWEWQSETYVMKQQGHSHNTTVMAYSPDAQYIATGGEDGKVKVWTVRDGFCFVTFTEHKGSITGVVWTQGCKAVISASQDGSIRAFDLKRFRNFRTLTTPEPAQFSCLAVDSSGDVVCAGAQDVFDIFLWSLQTGRLLDVISGHSGPVSGVHFNPTHPNLASVSWDKTVRVWDVFEGKGRAEVMDLPSEGLAVQFSPDGQRLATLSLDSQITFYDWKQAVQTGLIECKLDMDPGRGEKDNITAKKAGAARSFTSFCYSDDGEYVLAGGQSRFICLYHVQEEILLKKFPVTCNFSLDAVAEDIDRRKLTEFGSMALVDDSDSEGEGGRRGAKKPKLPGARSGDASERSYRPEIRTTALHFSPTGREWAACTTEGVLVYSLDDSVLFDPFQLEEDITPEQIRKCLRKMEFGTALISSLKLNKPEIILETFQQIPVAEVQSIVQSLLLPYVERLLRWMGQESLAKTRHLEFYLLWLRSLLRKHGGALKNRTRENGGVLNDLQQALTLRQSQLQKLCDHNVYSIEYILQVLERRTQAPVDA